MVKKKPEKSKELLTREEYLENNNELKLVIQKNSDAIQKNSEAIQKNSEAIQKVDEAVQNNSAAIQKVEQAVQKNSVAIQKVDEAVQNNSAAIQKVEQALEKQAIELIKHGEKLKKVDKIDIVEENTNKILDLLDKMKSDKEDYERKSDFNTNRIKDHEERIVTLESYHHK